MKKLFYPFLFLAFLGFTACGDDDDDIKLPDVTVNFAATEVGIDEDNSSKEVSINLSRKTDVSVDVSITLTSSDVVYGEDFTTEPAATNNVVKVNIPAGSTAASFKVSKAYGAVLEGTEKVKFEITNISATEGFKMGDKKEAVLTFGAIQSDGGTLTLEGKTTESPYANQVYVDFSNNAQESINRKSWNLGFYCGNEFRVFLNPSMQMAAAATTKSNINEVNVSDAAGIPTLVPVMTEGKFINLDNIDNLEGDITKTAFAEVSATDATNKVYIVAMEGHTTTENFYKIKVSRKDAGYKVEYGLLGSSDIKTVEVSKNADYSMVGISFETQKAVNVEPKAKSWDIQWAYGTGKTTNAGNDYAYFMQDLVYINNVAGAQAVEVMFTKETKEERNAEFKAFGKDNLKDLTFSSNRSVIGSNWRVTAKMNGSTEEVGVRANRFYVVKDPNGNCYKLRFIRGGFSDAATGKTDGGERGRPEIEYALIK